MQLLYYSSPLWLQNALVSIYGGYQRRKRYGGEYPLVYREVRGLRRLTLLDLQDLQRRRLASMLDHCARNVPYYRDSFRSALTRQSSPLAILRTLPVLGKQMLRERRGEFLAEGARAYWRNQTSGSTGTALSVDLDAYTYRLTMALLAEHESLYGIEPGDARATFAGRALQPPETNHPPFWRYNRADNQTLFSTLHLNDENMPHYLQHLQKVQPREIIGYPSAIYAVAEYCLRNNVLPGVRPAAVVTNSETLFEWQRVAIGRAFECPVADYYGVAEGVAFASQCSAGRYHFNPLLSMVEFLAPDGSDAAPNQPARLVCTTLTNRVMPLLRYEIGDEVVFADGDCPCGSIYPAAHAIVGRVDDAVITPDGRAVGRLDHIFKGMEGVRECQIVQDGIDQITLKVVRDAAFSERSRRMLSENLWARVGRDMRVQIEFVERIPRTARGKFKGVVSNVRRAGQPALPSQRGRATGATPPDRV